jgi:hypothetical protein
MYTPKKPYTPNMTQKEIDEAAEDMRIYLRHKVEILKKIQNDLSK